MKGRKPEIISLPPAELKEKIDRERRFCRELLKTKGYNSSKADTNRNNKRVLLGNLRLEVP